MKYNLAPLEHQVFVITGASSGIGLSTAKRAAEQGAKVFLISRNAKELDRICEQITEAGGHAYSYAADVGDAEEMKKAAERAYKIFGRIDTWVNNAGVSIYGRLTQVPLSEKRKLFETNFWGVVHGCRAALPYLSRRGGALINMGSVLSERALPLQGIYVASKHAVKGYTDALRLELQKDHVPVAVSLIEPSSIDTPYPQHARNHMDKEPALPPPLYDPSVVAEAILACAEKYHRDVQIGAAAPIAMVGEVFAPKLNDMAVNAFMHDGQKGGESKGEREDSLFAPPAREGKERGGNPGYHAKSSLYSAARLNRSKVSLFAGASAAMLAAAFLGRSRSERSSSSWLSQRH